MMPSEKEQLSLLNDFVCKLLEKFGSNVYRECSTPGADENAIKASAYDKIMLELEALCINLDPDNH